MKSLTRITYLTGLRFAVPPLPTLRSATIFMALVAAQAMSPAMAQAESVDESRPAAADGRIEFSAVTGDFEIIGHDAEEWLLSGTLGDDVKELVIEGSPEHWKIRLEMKNGGFNWGMGKKSSELKLLVPHGSELDVQAVSADLRLRELSGRSVDAQTVSGDLDLRQVNPARLHARTVSGDLIADGGASEAARLKSVSGDIDASGFSGRIELESVSGNVSIQGAGVSELSVESVSGDVAVGIRPTERARLEISSHSGDVDLRLPAESGVRIDAKSFSGSIASAFGGEVQSGRGPGESLSTETGSAGVEIKANSFSGNVRIRHLD